MRTEIDMLATEGSLALISRRRRGDFYDHPDLEGNTAIKNVCAKVPRSLSEDIDYLCELLGISKRRFLEAAMMDAVTKAHQIVQDEGVFDELGMPVSEEVVAKQVNAIAQSMSGGYKPC